MFRLDSGWPQFDAVYKTIQALSPPLFLINLICPAGNIRAVMFLFCVCECGLKCDDDGWDLITFAAGMMVVVGGGWGW